MSNSYVVSLNDAINCLNGFVSDMHSEYKKKGVNVNAAVTGDVIHPTFTIFFSGT